MWRVFFLNLPRKVSKGTGTGSLEYIYDAAGNKLAKKLDGMVVNFYCGSVVYTGSKAVEYVAHPEGIAHKSGSSFAYQYNQTDHLGNVRSVADASKTVVQATDYFPFGLAHSTNVASLAKNKYLYNGKELQTELGFNMSDYGARMYDQILGVWHSIDPLAEKYYGYSPYNYVLNRPLNAIDPNGMDVWEMDFEGKVKWISKSDGHVLYALNGDGERTGNSITVEDRSILDGLTETGLKSGYKTSYVQGNPSELASVFLFGSDNTNVEWLFSRHNTGSGDQYAIGTVHNSDRAISSKQMGFSDESEIASIHSHPRHYSKMTGKYGEHGSMGWRIMTDYEASSENVSKGTPSLSGDSHNVHYNPDLLSSSNYFTYFPYSGNIYQVRGYKHPAFIRNIKNNNSNPKKLFWGTLNGR